MVGPSFDSGVGLTSSVPCLTLSLASINRFIHHIREGFSLWTPSK